MDRHQTIRAVIFDMDGVLTDSEPLINAAAIAMFKEKGLVVQPEDFQPFVGMGEERYVGGVAETYHFPFDPAEGKRRTYEIYFDLVPSQLQAFPGVAELLQNCRKAGLLLAVASSADGIKIQANLEKIGFPFEFWDAVVRGEEVKKKKPAPDIFLLAANQLGMEPAECVVVEDAVNGIQAAKAAGMRCVAVATTFPSEKLNEADVVREKVSNIQLSDLAPHLNRNMSFLNTFIDNVHKFPNKVAIEFIDPPLQRVTYAELNDLVDRTAGYLQSLGLQPGDRVAIQLSKSLEFILVHLATIRLGAISLPLNLAYPPDELKYFLEDSGAKLFFALKSSKEKIESILPQLPNLQQCVFLDPSNPEEFQLRITNYELRIPNSPTLDSSDTAVIIYTSGTTGRPKGAEITHGNLLSNLEALHAAWGWREDDILLHVLPIFHVHGLFVALHGALHTGATTLLMREFNAERTLELLSSGQCTVFMAVPTIHKRLLDVPNASQYDLSRVRLITSGSDRLPDDLFTGFQKTFGYTLLERYGMTETGMNCSNPLNGERRIGSVGMPLPGVKVRIVHSETGEILPTGEIGDVQLRGPNVFKGYWQQPEKTSASFSADGWFKTGDLGYLEADGYLTLCGRSKDLIISGGLNIYPPEVERVLMEHPAVNACAVIGCPDVEWGEKVTAVVVLHKTEAVSAEELIRFCREKLAPYKSPKSIVFREDLPRNAMGKVQKAELRKVSCA